ncbi:MAG: PAS domain S-box protein [Opitutaceae bacterium]|nr:PAS domain S-box protein [Opitutaceae bacterium]MBP9911929.1 PAS domain S-box protein [Opitutaceae bacterium]
MTGQALLLLAALIATLAWLARLRHQLAEVQQAAERERWELQRQHASALGEQQDRLSAVLAQMLEALIVVDAAGRIQLANWAAAQLFGFQLPVEGRPLLEVVRHHEFSVLLARLGHEPEVQDYELHLEGTVRRTLKVNAVRLLDARAQPAGALFVVHDLTALRKLEGLRVEFVANVSHELRTPLSLIKGAAETLLDGGYQDPVALPRFLGIIDRHASRLSLLIEDLLLLSSLDSGRIVLRSDSVELHDLTEEIMGDFRVPASERGISLQNSLPATLWARGDAGRLRQVLSNLVDNAIKHGGKGSVEVGGGPLSAGWIELWVRDEGPGIPAEVRERVFERFFRVDKARSRPQGGGTGLGLAIVKNLVQAHGGEVRVESGEGRGTTFFLKLPSA